MISYPVTFNADMKQTLVALVVLPVSKGCQTIVPELPVKVFSCLTFIIYNPWSGSVHCCVTIAVLPWKC